MSDLALFVARAVLWAMLAGGFVIAASFIAVEVCARARSWTRRRIYDGIRPRPDLTDRDP